MKYRSSYKGLQQRRPPAFARSASKMNMRMWALVVGFVLLFVGSVFIFRNTKHEKPIEKAIEVIEATEVTKTLTQLDATLVGVSSNKSVGTAARSIANGVFHLNMSAALPGIDRESQFYQAWLVRPVPYDYVSAGEMVTNDLGTFVLDWNGSSDKDYSGYTDLVITLQARGGDTDPQTHIVEGGFGK